VHNQSQPEIPAFLTRLRHLADDYGRATGRDRFLVAEVGGDRANQEMKQYTAGADRLHSAYGFLYLYADALSPELVDRGPAMWPGVEGEGWPSWTFSNHDAPRAISRWAEGRDEKTFAEMAMLLLMTLRGNVFVYQGEELGLPQAHVPFERLVDPEAIANWPETLGRDGARTTMPWCQNALQAGFSNVEPWLPVDPRHIQLAVDAQEADPSSSLHLARRLIALRQAHPVLRTGSMTMVTAKDGLLVFRRGEGAGTLLCVFNLGHDDIAWTRPGGWTTIESVNDTGPGSDSLPPMIGRILVRTAG
jgi:alpha-glucosidase